MHVVYVKIQLTEIIVFPEDLSDGIDATLKIKSIGHGHSVPIIAHSAYVLNNEKELSLPEGCADYVPKPVKKEELLSVVKKHILKH